MENKEIANTEDIVCPYCKETIVKWEGVDYKICEHTIFIATDEGFEYIRDDVKRIIKEDRNGGSYDSYTARLPINGIRISSYAGNCFSGLYLAFVE
jgi:hypothetical protein